MRDSVKFTLVELLVVVAVIAILTSLLLPALGKARDSAKQISCMNSMKQTGTLLVAYEGDCGFLPAPWTTSGAISFAGTSYNYNSWTVKLMVAGYLPQVPRIGWSWGPAAANCNVLHCPANIAQDCWNYGMNDCLSAYMGIDSGVGIVDWRSCFIRMNRICKPAQKMLLGEVSSYPMIEGVGTSVTPLNFAWYPHPKLKMNIIYVDAHAGSGVYGVSMGNNSSGPWNPLFGPAKGYNGGSD